MESTFYTNEQLKNMGFKSVGTNVLISDKTVLLSPEKMTIGNNVRIDAFSFLSGEIIMHNNVHIATYCSLIAGNAGIEMESFSGLSSKCSIYAVSDDYSGEYLTNPTIPNKFKNVIAGKVYLKKHVIVGVGSTILPNVILNEGVSIGGMSLVTKSLDEWGMYAGIPVRKLKDRNKKVLDLEKQYIKEYCENKYKIGDRAFIIKVIDEHDVNVFGEVSGDKNPIHFDENYAKNSVFKKRIVHGILTSSLISNVIGNQLPGNGTIYLSQSLKFLAPVYLGDEVTAIVEIIDINYEKRFLTLKTECYANKNNLVVSGEAKVKI